MKKLFSILFLFLLLLKIGGFVAVLSVEREIVRENRLKNISNDVNTQNLTCIVDNKKIEWEETGREFWYNDKLYDVVKTETKNGQKCYYCLADEAETDIVATIKNLVQDGHEPLSKALTGFMSWALDSVFLINDNLLTTKPVWSIIEQLYNSLEQNYSFNYYSKTIKPPR